MRSRRCSLNDVVVIGAGVSGLACAGRLVRDGRRVLVLDKSRGVGGRCATRRIEGQPVDLGVTFLHGSDPRFVAAIHAIPDSERVRWPTQIAGEGPPCAPGALDSGVEQWAIHAGLNGFAKSLADGVTVQRQTRVTTLSHTGSGWRLGLASGDAIDAATVVLAVPLEQAQELLASLDVVSPDIRAVRSLMQLSSSSSCLTVAALYETSAPDPGFDVMHPPLSSCIALLSHDSSKRTAPAFRALVIQGRTSWSRERLEAPSELWSLALLDEAARLLGTWVCRPVIRYEHRWRFARIDGAPAFRRPVLIAVGKARLALTGEGFSESGGVQGAFLAGLDLAERLLEDV